MFDLSGTMAAMCDVVGDRLKARRSYHTGQPPQPEPAAPQKATRRSEMRVQEKPAPATVAVAEAPEVANVVEPVVEPVVERVVRKTVDLDTPPADFPEAPAAPEAPAEIGKPDWWANFRRTLCPTPSEDDPWDSPKFDGEIGRTRIGDDVVIAITETKDDFVFVSAKRLVKRSGEWKMESYKTAIVKGTLKSAVDDDWLTAHQWLHGLLNTT